jgi:hypothetical protein
MRKGLLAVSLILLISLVALFPACEGETTGTIQVKATLDGVPWTGAVSYTLTPATGTATSGSSVDKSFTLEAGTWTCAYVAGGPGAFVDITPSATQTLATGQGVTFTLNFQTVPALNAEISFESWTINGQKVAGGQTYVLHPNDWVDVEYNEHMFGPSGNVTVHQTSWLKVHNIGFEGEPGPSIWLHVLNDPGAIYMDPPAQGSNQQCTVEGAKVNPCDEVELKFCQPVNLDVEIDWELQICTQYTKTINWISFPSFHPILFDVPSIPPGSPESFPYYGMSLNLTTWASVDLPGDTDPTDDTTPESDWLVVTFMP